MKNPADVELGAGTRLRFEAFDSAYFAHPVYTLLLRDDPSSSGLAETLARMHAELSRRPFSLIMARTREIEQSRTLEAAGFRRIETQLTFSRTLSAADIGLEDPRVRPAVSEDIESCAALGAEAFVYDRYHEDPEIGSHIAGAIKSTWVRNNLSGRADRCFVAEIDRQVVGFNLCKTVGHRGIIDLIAVDHRYRRRGVAAGLVRGAIAAFAKNGGREMIVKTQETNLQSAALYRGTGFEQCDWVWTYHLTAATAPAALR